MKVDEVIVIFLKKLLKLENFEKIEQIDFDNHIRNLLYLIDKSFKDKKYLGDSFKDLNIIW